MSYWIYSTESLPSPDLMGKPGYTPDQEFIRWAGLTLPPIPAKTWTQLPSYLKTTKKWNSYQQPEEVEVHISKFAPIIRSRRGAQHMNSFEERGVIFIDHEPKGDERRQLEQQSEEHHREWCMFVIQTYEDMVREHEVTGRGRTKPTPYEDYCYSQFPGMEKPYSVKHFQALRDPGQVAADKMAAAFTKVTDDLVTKLASVQTEKPKTAATK